MSGARGRAGRPSRGPVVASTRPGAAGAAGEAAGNGALNGGGRRRPAVVAIGGGHGLSRSLLAIRTYAGSVTAVVSVADDGGSSGRLREALGIPAPGDLRRCLGSLLPGRSPLGDALELRFENGELEGHAFGNILLAALSVTTGDFVRGVDEACKLLRTVGRVYPATSTPVVLCASAEGGEVAGQVRITGARGITRISLDPPEVATPPEAVAAIEAADEIVIGPGSLYTSVLAALAPAEISRALRASRARIVYVANLREQVAETAGYAIGEHVCALVAHGVVPDVVLADTADIALGEVPEGLRVVTARLSSGSRTEHDTALLAAALQGLSAGV